MADYSERGRLLHDSPTHDNFRNRRSKSGATILSLCFLGIVIVIVILKQKFLGEQASFVFQSALQQMGVTPEEIPPEEKPTLLPDLGEGEGGSGFIPDNFLVHEAFCTNQKRVIVAIKAQPHDFELRQNKRAELAAYPDWVRQDVSLAFILGRPSKLGVYRDLNEITDNIVNESRVYRDVVIGDFIDMYQNLALKSIYTAKVLYEKCKLRNVISALTDEDVAINFAIMRNYLVSLLDRVKAQPPEPTPQKRAIWAGIIYGGSPVIHDQRHKNYENLSRSYFPDYMSGVMNVFNEDTALLFLKHRRLDPHRYFNDDAMFGVLLESENISMTNVPEIILFETSNSRKIACGGNPTESISECDCHKWWAYQCSNHGDAQVGKEYAIAVDSAKNCPVANEVAVAAK